MDMSIFLLVPLYPYLSLSLYLSLFLFLFVYFLCCLSIWRHGMWCRDVGSVGIHACALKLKREKKKKTSFHVFLSAIWYISLYVPSSAEEAAAFSSAHACEVTAAISPYICRDIERDGEILYSSALFNCRQENKDILIYIHIEGYSYRYTSTIYIYMSPHWRIHSHIYIYIYINVEVFTWIYIYVIVRIYIYMYITRKFSYSCTFVEMYIERRKLIYRCLHASLACRYLYMCAGVQTLFSHWREENFQRGKSIKKTSEPAAAVIYMYICILNVLRCWRRVVAAVHALMSSIFLRGVSIFHFFSYKTLSISRETLSTHDTYQSVYRKYI